MRSAKGLLLALLMTCAAPGAGLASPSAEDGFRWDLAEDGNGSPITTRSETPLSAMGSRGGGWPAVTSGEVQGWSIPSSGGAGSAGWGGAPFMVGGTPEAVMNVEGRGRIVVSRLDGISQRDWDPRKDVALRRGGREMAAAVERPFGEMQLFTQFDAPGRLVAEYRIDMPPGFRIRVLPEAAGVAIEDSRGNLVAGMAPAWARSSSGKNLGTRYVWDEQRGVLAQEIDPSGLLPEDFPVVADPYLGKRLYHKSTISGTKSRYKINAFVTPWGRAWTGRATFGYHRDEVRSQLGGRASWYTGTIREQHYCHVFFGGPTHWEPDYNMESWRRYVSWWRQAQNKCNP